MSFLGTKAGDNLVFDLLNGTGDDLMDVIKGQNGKPGSTFSVDDAGMTLKESVLPPM
jgi:hypothetical protein